MPDLRKSPKLRQYIRKIQDIHRQTEPYQKFKF